MSEIWNGNDDTIYTTIVERPRFPVVDFDKAGLDGTYLELADVAGRSPLDQFSEGWKQTLQRLSVKTADIRRKIENEGAAAQTRTNGNKILTAEQRKIAISQVESTVESANQLLDNQIEMVNRNAQENAVEVKAAFEKDPKMADSVYDPIISRDSRRAYTIAAIYENYIAFEALDFLYKLQWKWMNLVDSSN